MIVNWSRLSQFGKCPEKVWNWSELHLETFSPELNLIKGSGFHEGVARFFATHDIHDAQETAEAKMRSELEGKLVLEEERPEINQAIAWSKMAVGRFAENYMGQPVQVLWPEVQFCVPIPGTWHHCWEMHRRYCKDVPYKDCPAERRLSSTHPTDDVPVKFPVCWQPHYFRGKTDAVVSYLDGVWLMEHKTNSMKLEQFVDRYFLDGQTTGYLYGIWKSTGVLPDGFILNVIQKPHPNAKDQMQVGFAREPFQRSLDDLTKWEGEFITQANDYERAFRDRNLGNPFSVVRRTTACMDYSRKCTYFAKCQRHPAEALEGEFLIRENDYVEKQYEEIFQKWKETYATN